MSSQLSTAFSVSGVSIVMITAQPGDVRSRTEFGQMWSSTTLRCLTERYFNLHKYLRDRGLFSQDCTIIVGIDSFGSGGKVHHEISDILAILEKSSLETSTVSSSERRAKGRSMERTVFGYPYREFRVQVVKSTRATIMRQLTQLHTETW